MIFFTSDSHFNDKVVVKRENRPFKDTKDCDSEIIKIWNKQAKKGDIIYFLGDFVSYGENYKDIYKEGIKNIKKIKAEVILVIGNNEERLIKGEFKNNFEEFKNYCLNLGFKDVKTEEFLEIKVKKFYLNHYPANFKNGYISLYEHLHKLGGIYNKYGINVSCDLNCFRLYSIDDIFSLLSMKKDLEKYAPELLEYKVNND